MIKLEHVETMNFKNALRGMRNPLESWDLSDTREYLYANALLSSSFNENDYKVSKYIDNHALCVEIGYRDLDRAQKLVLAGSDHRKFMRQIFITIDITAPLYWWKEMDTYKIATVANSTSTMHKLATTPITRDCFSFDYFETLESLQLVDYELPEERPTCDAIDNIIFTCENLRLKYLETKDISYWRILIQLLPDSWNQMRTWTGDYEVMRNIHFARHSHKLSEWQEFCHKIETLPYAKELICLTK